jgi:hypothetical protein
MGVVWYADEDEVYADFTPAEIQHLAVAPVETHIYSTVEMKGFSTTKEDQHYEHTMTRKNKKLQHNQNRKRRGRSQSVVPPHSSLRWVV